MDYVQIVCDLVFTLCLGLFIKSYLPSYMKKKGENLATKEDITEITRRSEAVQNEFRENLEKFSADVRFKYDLFYAQYNNLYTKLYAIICQSEYLRRILIEVTKKEYPFDEYPFFEIKKRRTKQEVAMGNGHNPAVITEESEVEDSVTQFCKKELYREIINNSQYATPELIKLAVSYRYVHDNNDVSDSKIKKVFEEKELQLIAEIVKRIVIDYNYFRKELRMSYSENELLTGLLD